MVRNELVCITSFCFALFCFFEVALTRIHPIYIYRSPSSNGSHTDTHTLLSVIHHHTQIMHTHIQTCTHTVTHTAYTEFTHTHTPLTHSPSHTDNAHTHTDSHTHSDTHSIYRVHPPSHCPQLVHCPKSSHLTGQAVATCTFAANINWPPEISLEPVSVPSPSLWVTAYNYTGKDSGNQSRCCQIKKMDMFLAQPLAQLKLTSTRLSVGRTDS